MENLAQRSSNQNLYAKEVFLKFKDRKSFKKVLMKVKGRALESSKPRDRPFRENLNFNFGFGESSK